MSITVVTDCSKRCSLEFFEIGHASYQPFNFLPSLKYAWGKNIS